MVKTTENQTKKQMDNTKSIKSAFKEVSKSGPVFEDDPHDFLMIGLNTEANNRFTAQKMKQEDFADDMRITNPFFVPLTGGTALSLPKKDFYTSYSYCYTLLLKSDVTQTVDTLRRIYDRELTVGELRRICEYFVLVKTDIKLLHNNRFKRVTNLIDKPILDTLFNHNGNLYRFQEQEFIVPFFNLTETNARNYLSLYTVSQNMDQLSSIMSTINLFNSDYTVPIDQNVEHLLQNLDPRSFWTLSKNCEFPLFKIFDERSFSYNGVRLDKIRSDTILGAKNINQLLETIEKNEGRKKKQRKIFQGDKNGYGLPGQNVDDNNTSTDTRSNGQTPKEFSKSEFQNLYKLLKHQKNRTFYVNTSDINITKGDIADIFDRITNEKYRFKLLNTLLVSKDYCHLVVNNKRVLERNADLFQKYRAFYSYAFAYAWITLYLEESILSTKSTRYSRHVYDLDTAHSLPSFPFSKTDLRRNPYITLLLPDDVIDPATNMVGLHSPYDHKKYHGLTDPEEAKRRFNIFCTGDPNKDLFQLDGVDSSILSVSGSIMTACLQKLSPLFENCTTEDTDYVTRWKTFFKHHYMDSDVDLMCSCDSISKLIMYGTKFIDHACKIFDMERSEVEIRPDKKSAIIIYKHFFKECVDDVNATMNTEYTFEDLIELFEQIDNEEYTEEFEELLQEYFYADYTAQKGKRNVEWRRSKKASEIKFDKELERSYTSFTGFKDFKITMSPYDVVESTMIKRDSDIYFFVNDFRDDDDKVPPEENYVVFKYSESLKFKVFGEKMIRPIEMFKVNECDPFNTVARFHLPCVRAYYQHGKFYMVPSFITAMQTGLNVDYKYFAGSRDPANICQKYISRGFGMILNSSEKKGIITYSKAVDEFNGMYKINDSSEIFGPKEITHNYFCPGVFKLGLDRDNYIETDTRYAKSNTDVAEAYSTESGYNPTDEECMINMFNINAITKTGNVSPYKAWVGDAFYDYMQSR